MLHIFMVLSSDADARNSPSCDQAMSEIPWSWPESVRKISPVYASHSLMTLSAPVLHDIL